MRALWPGILAFVLVASAGAAARGTSTGEASAAAPDAYVTVQFDTGVSAQSLDAAGRPPTLEAMGFRTLAVPPGRTPEDYAAELAAQPGVLSAVPDAPVRAAQVPDDPYYLGNGGGSSSQAQYLAQVNAPAAWDIHTGSTDVVVAVIDSGLDVTHPEFSGRLWENANDNGSDGVDRDGNGCINDRYGCRFINLTQVNSSVCGYGSSTATGAILDDMGSGPQNIGSHGTLVSGIIGAAGDNAQGIAGVAWKVHLLTVKVLDCRGEGSMAKVAEGITYAVRAGARIINISVASDPPHAQADIPVLRTALQLAQDSGVIVIAAAGNHKPGGPAGVAYPAAYTQYSNLIAVGASNNLDSNTWATYSNYGPAVDFAAPGNRLLSTARTDIGLANPYAEIGEPQAGFEGGTSFSAPLVSGMFALMLARNPLLGPADYIQAARAAATPAAPASHGQEWAGSGIIDIGGAVARVPMSLSGTPQKDWMDVPGGTPIEARVGATVCGTTTAVGAGPVSTYTLKVRSGAETPGCGAPGATVQVLIGGSSAQPSIPWGGLDEKIGLSGQTLSTVPPAPGATVSQQLGSGWSNVSHLGVSGALPEAASAIPLPWNVIYRWAPLKASFEAAGGYERFARTAPGYANDFQQLDRFDAYWVDGPAASLATPNPGPAPGRTVALQPGWNNFTFTGPSKAIATALAGIAGKYDQVLHFDNATGTWLSYIPGQPRYLNAIGGLFTYRVYWVHMDEAGTLTFG